MTGTTNPRYFFIHLQKTGGTALLQRLRGWFGDRPVYPDNGDGDPETRVISVRHLLEVWDRRGDEIEVVTGHFPLCTTEVLGGQFATFTILRDPVERTLSYLRHQRQLQPRLREVPIEHIYREPRHFDWLLRDHMVRMLSLTVEELGDGALTQVPSTPDRLERAIERLHTIDLVGVQERFEDFCDELEQRFGWDLGPPRQANRTDPSTSADASESFRERIAADNALDVELYRAALELVDLRRPALAADPT